MSNSKQKNVLIALLGLILAGSLGYNLFLNQDVSTKETKIKGKDILLERSSKEKVELQATLDNLSQEFEQLQEDTIEKDSIMIGREQEISDFKHRIKNLLKQDQVGDKELREAKNLLATYKESLAKYKADYLKLKEENTLLKSDNDTLQANVDKLNQEQLLASERISKQSQEIEEKSKTIRKIGQPKLTYLKVEPYKERSSGKLVETSRARRADLMRIEFEFKGNEYTQDKTAIAYLAIYKPDNTLVKLGSQTLGELTLKSGESRFYSEKFEMDLGEVNKKVVSLDWKKEGFDKGDYRFIMYSQGEIVHSEMIHLK